MRLDLAWRVPLAGRKEMAGPHPFRPASLARWALAAVSGAFVVLERGDDSGDVIGLEQEMIHLGDAPAVGPGQIEIVEAVINAGVQPRQGCAHAALAKPAFEPGGGEGFEEKKGISKSVCRGRVTSLVERRGFAAIKQARGLEFHLPACQTPED